jgi:hypothetical protein
VEKRKIYIKSRKDSQKHSLRIASLINTIAHTDFKKSRLLGTSGS